MANAHARGYEASRLSEMAIVIEKLNIESIHDSAALS